jgi:phosphatidylinositol glycan class W
VEYPGGWYVHPSGAFVPSSANIISFKANLPYILWVAAFNTSFLLAYLVVLDISFFPGPKPKKKEKPLDLISMSGRASPYVTSSQQPPVDEAVEQGNPPQLLEAINNHGLVLFLLVRLLSFIFLILCSLM